MRSVPIIVSFAVRRTIFRCCGIALAKGFMNCHSCFIGQWWPQAIVKLRFSRRSPAQESILGGASGANYGTVKLNITLKIGEVIDARSHG